MNETEEEALDPEKVRGWFHTFVNDKCVCRYCGFDGSRSLEDWLQLQGDHLIPRGIAAENAEDELNRVTSCFYCNMVKRHFDPTMGETNKVQNSAHQQELVERAQKEIQRRMKRTWGYGGGPMESYKFMMQQIKS